MIVGPRPIIQNISSLTATPLQHEDSETVTAHHWKIYIKSDSAGALLARLLRYRGVTGMEVEPPV
jgi:hypothetical protein